MIRYRQYINAVNPRLSNPKIGPDMTVGKDGVTVEIALEEFVSVDFRKAQNNAISCGELRR